MIITNNEEKASISIRKIIGVFLLSIFLFGIAVLATNAQVNTVKIVLSSDYEMDVITSKTKVSDILEEKHIILLPDEKVTPSLDEEITTSKKIVISKLSDDEEIVQLAENSIDLSMENVLEHYGQITEKIIVEEVAIPYETITKDVSNGGSETRDRVIRNGQDGLKQVTYRVKYQNGVEIEKTEISSQIIKEPVSKIVQVQKVTTRSQSASRTSNSVISYGNGRWSYSASEMDLICAITAQECSSSYAGALAVITTACNRAESRGTDPLTEYKRKGQFCYSIDNHWKRRLNGNYSSVVRQAVTDALNGKRNHGFYSFRSASTGKSGTVIGGNVYF